MKNYLVLTVMIFSAGILFSQNAADLIKKGNEYYDKKIYDKALQYFTNAVHSNPDDIDLHLKIALSASNLKNYEQSIAFFNKAITLQNKLGKEVPSWWLISNGYNYHYINKYKEAVECFLQVYNGTYDKQTKNDTLFPLVHLYFLLGDYDLFFKFASLCLNVEKDKGRINLTNNFLANAHYKLKHIEEALHYAEKCGKDFWIYKLYSPKKITFTCSFDLTKLANHKPGIYHIPLPVDTDYQELVSVKSTPPYQKIMRNEGETYAIYDFNAGFPKQFLLEFTVKKRVMNQTPVKLQEYNDADSEIGFFATPRVYENHSILYDYDHPLVKSTFNDLKKNNRPNIEQVEAVAHFMLKKIPHLNIKYDAKTAYGKKMIDYYNSNIKKISDVLKYQTGHCVHRPNTFTALLRLFHIPARTILGFSCVVSESYSGFEVDGHGLAEVFDAGSQKWIQAAIHEENIWRNSWEHVIWYRETRRKPDNYIPLYIGYYIKMLNGKVQWNAQDIPSKSY